MLQRSSKTASESLRSRPTKFDGEIRASGCAIALNGPGDQWQNEERTFVSCRGAIVRRKSGKVREVLDSAATATAIVKGLLSR